MPNALTTCSTVTSTGSPQSGRRSGRVSTGAMYFTSERTSASIGFFFLVLALSGDFAGVAPFEEGFGGERDQREESEERGDREGGGVLVVVVENLDLQRHRVGSVANVPGYHRDRAELAHG